MPLPVNISLPAIFGTAEVGETLTASIGEWISSILDYTYLTSSGGIWATDLTTFTYQWYSGGVAISGAIENTYVPVDGDYGNELTVSVTATNAAGSSSAVMSIETTATAARGNIMSSGLNRIHVTVPGSSSTPLADRDALITQMKTAYPGTWNYYHYSDIASGMEIWSYTAIGVSISTQGVATVVTVTCGGIGIPPTGSDILALDDPGYGSTYTWTQIGAPLKLSTSGDGSVGASAPAGNNNYYVWDVTAQGAGDFATAIAATEAALAGALTSNTVIKRYFKYTDTVSGAWQVWAIYFGAGSAQFGTTSSVDVITNNNILYIITCSGSPHQPTGSPINPAALPSFSETFTTLYCRLNFGPQR